MKPTIPLFALALVIACDPSSHLASASAAASPGDRASSPQPPPTPAPSTPASSTPAPSTPAPSTPVSSATSPAAAPAVPRESAGGGVDDRRIAAVVGDAPRTPDTFAPTPVVNGLSVTVHRYVNPPRSADAKENYWTQFQAWGEITNHSTQTFESVTARIIYFDAAGGMIGVESIASLSQQDAGDHAPGETVLGEVGFVAPGESVPFHVMRNLDAIKGQIAGFAIYPRLGLPAASSVPRGVALDVKDALEGEPGLQTRTFRGIIRNDGSAGCRDPYFVVALLDDAGHIGAVESTLVTDDVRKTLAPGESIGFAGRVHLYDDNAWKATAGLRTWVDCKAPYD